MALCSPHCCSVLLMLHVFPANVRCRSQHSFIVLHWFFFSCVYSLVRNPISIPEKLINVPDLTFPLWNQNSVIHQRRVSKRRSQSRCTRSRTCWRNAFPFILALISVSITRTLTKCLPLEHFPVWRTDSVVKNLNSLQTDMISDFLFHLYLRFSSIF